MASKIVISSSDFSCEVISKRTFIYTVREFAGTEKELMLADALNV